MIERIPPPSVNSLQVALLEPVAYPSAQLALAVEAEISARHVSFLETGHAQPSREMVVLLAKVLDVPLRKRNDLLTTAGYAPLYCEAGLDAPAMAQLHRAFNFILGQQEPYPTLLLDRHWNVLKVNGGR